jgi:hypothetical protein
MRSRKSAIVLVLLVLLLAGLLWLRPWARPAEVLPPATAAVEISDALGPEPASPPVAARVIKETSTVTVTEPQVQADPSLQRIVLLFEDEHGSPVPAWRFRYELMTREMAIGRLGPPPEDDEVEEEVELQLSGIGQSDAAGRFELLEGREFSGGKVFQGLLEGLSPGYAFRDVGGIVGESKAGQFGFGVAEAGGTVTVPLARTSLISFVVEYADGEPFSGTVGVEVPIPFSRGSLIEVAAGEVATYARPSVEGDLAFGCISDRIGFRGTNRWKFDARQAPSFVRLVIPEDPQQCFVTVDLSEWPEGETVTITVNSGGGGIFFNAEAQGGTVWRTLQLNLPRVPYKLQASGPSGVWRSESFQIVRGGTHQLNAVPAKPFSARARFLDESGNPVAGGCLHIMDAGYPPWLRFSRVQLPRSSWTHGNLMAFSGQDGVAILPNLPAGTIELFLEARGTEVQTRTIQGTPGEVVDLGDIVLAPATGRLEIHLVNRKPGAGYTMRVHTPGGIGVIAEIRGITEDLYVLSGVAPRPYQIFLTDGSSGGPVPNPVVHFDGDVAVLYVDVQEWRRLESGDVLPD